MNVAIIIGIVVVAAAVVCFLLRSSGRGAPAAGRAASAPAADDGRRANWLVGWAGEVAGKTYHIGYRTVTIGRAPTNFIQITDSEASRVHCQLTPKKGWLQVVDMGSQNGTMVNGKPVAQGRLEPGGELAIGDAKFIFQIQAAAIRNDAMVQKAIDPSTGKSTVAADGQNLAYVIESVLRETDGDMAAAAKKLGIEESILRRIAAEKGVGASPNR